MRIAKPLEHFQAAVNLANTPVYVLENFDTDSVLSILTHEFYLIFDRQSLQIFDSLRLSSGILCSCRQAIVLCWLPQFGHGRLVAKCQILEAARRVSQPACHCHSIDWFSTQCVVSSHRRKHSKFQRLSKLSQTFWMYGILSSLVSSTAGLVRLRAEGRRLALNRSITSDEKGPEAVTSDNERKEQGRKLLQYVRCSVS